MPLASIQVYLSRLPGLNAEKKQELNEVIMRPWMSESNQIKVQNVWQRAIHGGDITTKKATKSDLARIGLGVR